MSDELTLEGLAETVIQIASRQRVLTDVLINALPLELLQELLSRVHADYTGTLDLQLDSADRKNLRDAIQEVERLQNHAAAFHIGVVGNEQN